MFRGKRSYPSQPALADWNQASGPWGTEQCRLAEQRKINQPEGPGSCSRSVGPRCVTVGSPSLLGFLTMHAYGRGWAEAPTLPRPHSALASSPVPSTCLGLFSVLTYFLMDRTRYLVLLLVLSFDMVLVSQGYREQSFRVTQRWWVPSGWACLGKGQTHTVKISWLGRSWPCTRVPG